MATSNVVPVVQLRDYQNRTGVISHTRRPRCVWTLFEVRRPQVPGAGGQCCVTGKVQMLRKRNFIDRIDTHA